MLDRGGVSASPSGYDQGVNLYSDAIASVVRYAIEFQEHLSSSGLCRFCNYLAALNLQRSVGDLVEQRGTDRKSVV